MGRRVFQNLSFASQPPARERAEPRLLPADPPLPFRRPGQPDGAIPSAAQGNATRSGIAPVLDAADLGQLAPAVRDTSASRLIAVAGCIVFAAAGVGSAAFLLLANPDREVVGAAASGRSPAPPQTVQSAGPVSGSAAAPHPAATGAAPSPPSAPPHPEMNDAVLQSPSGLPLASLPPSTTNPARSATASPATPPSSRAAADVPQQGAGAATVQPQGAGRPATAGADARHGLAAGAIADAGATRSRAEVEPASRVHPAERHTHLRSGRVTRTLSARAAQGRVAPPRRSARVAGAVPVRPTGERAEFSELLEHLTGSDKPADRPPSNLPPAQTLTPPAPGAPDPFAQGASSREAGQ
jgi:hypothetical protein